MYLLEGDKSESMESFSSIPVAMYWGVITLTTIGYGDIYPTTTGGQVFTGFVAFYAVCIGSIPIGIIGAGYVEELAKWRREEKAAANRERAMVRRQVAARAPATAAVASSTVTLFLLLGRFLVCIALDMGCRQTFLAVYLPPSWLICFSTPAVAGHQ